LNWNIENLNLALLLILPAFEESAMVSFPVEVVVEEIVDIESIADLEVDIESIVDLKVGIGSIVDLEVGIDIVDLEDIETVDFEGTGNSMDIVGFVDIVIVGFAGNKRPSDMDCSNKRQLQYCWWW
jgi:hypothetical protein